MEVNTEGSRKEWLSLSPDLPPEEISGACPPPCHGGSLPEAVMNPSSLGPGPTEQHHGVPSCTNAMKGFAWTRPVLPERGGIARAVILCGRAILYATPRGTLLELMPVICLLLKQSCYIFFSLFCLVGVGKKPRRNHAGSTTLSLPWKPACCLPARFWHLLSGCSAALLRAPLYPAHGNSRLLLHLVPITDKNVPL